MAIHIKVIRIKMSKLASWK